MATKVLTKLGQMFRDSWTGGASGEAGRYHSKGDWERFKFKDLFDNDKWVREQMVDENGNPMYSARTGEPIMTSYYRPSQRPRSTGSPRQPGRTKPNRRSTGSPTQPGKTTAYRPVDTSPPEEAMYGAGEYYPEAEYGAGYYSGQSPSQSDNEYENKKQTVRLGHTGGDARMLERPPVHIHGDANVAEGNYSPIQGPPEPVPQHYSVGQIAHPVYSRRAHLGADAEQGFRDEQAVDSAYNWQANNAAGEYVYNPYIEDDLADAEERPRVGVVPDANASAGEGGQGFTDQFGNYWPNNYEEDPDYDALREQRRIAHQQNKIAPTRSHLKSEEGYKRMPYIDPISGEWHVGHGHKITEAQAKQIAANGGWDRRQAGQQLDRDIVEARQGADHLFRKNGVAPENMPPGFREAISNMVFQMGTTGVSRFENMWAAIRDGRWTDVLTEMKDSAWAQSQTPDRADQVIAMARNSLAVGGS